MFENVERGWYRIGDKDCYFRSKWEANYALYLQWLKEQQEIKEWEYEPMPRFDFLDFKVNPPRVVGLGYLPDFKVINNDGTWYLVEIKGYSQGLQKLKRMKKYHPTVKIELVDAKEYKVLKNKIGRMLKWT